MACVRHPPLNSLWAPTPGSGLFPGDVIGLMFLVRLKQCMVRLVLLLCFPDLRNCMDLGTRTCAMTVHSSGNVLTSSV